MSSKTNLDVSENGLYQARDQDQNKEFYSNWAESYEKDCREQGYNGAYIVVKHFLHLNVPKEAKILDIGAGTGVVGELLSANGYQNVDALDGTPKMLEIAKQKNCYKNFVNSYVASDVRLPIEDQTYDVVIMSGVFCPGHVKVEAFKQIIRVVKSGGIICWSMGIPENYVGWDEEYRYFIKHLQSLCDQQKWTLIPPYPLNVENFHVRKAGFFYAMKVL